MAERLGDIEQRLESVDQLSSVVSAIQGIAAARLREADDRLAGIRSHAATIAEAIGHALTLLPVDAVAGSEGSQTGGGMPLVMALCSEQGFVGGFNSHVLGEVEGLLESQGPARIVMIGERGTAGLRERGLEAGWTAPMASHADEVLTLANRLTERLYSELRQGGVDRVLLVHAIPGQGAVTSVTHRLIPFDFARFPQTERKVPPLLNLPVQDLLALLAEEYVFSEICEALMLSYAAESEARMYAMLAAHENVGHKRDELTAQARRMRQDQITEEVIELSSGVAGDRSTR